MSHMSESFVSFTDGRFSSCISYVKLSTGLSSAHFTQSYEAALLPLLPTVHHSHHPSPFQA